MQPVPQTTSTTANLSRIIDTARRSATLHSRMARRSRRELDIADHLWECLTRIAEDCGTDRHAVVNQAVYEFARRFNFLTPMAKEVPAPDEPVAPGKNSGAAGQKSPSPKPAAAAPANNPPPAAAPPAKA